MALPNDEGQMWPPKHWKDIQSDVHEAAAWWSGDEEKLASLYGGTNTPPAGRHRRFWSRRKNPESQGNRGDRLHVPAAADIATVGADLLFGEMPSFEIPGATGDSAEQAAKDAQARLNQIVSDDGWDSTLLEAAEVAGGLSGVYLRPTWDKDVADHPFLSIVHPDRAVPEFRQGRLSAVTFWQVLDDGDEKKVWRHLERHTAQGIKHGLYCGDMYTLGARHPLTARRETKMLEDYEWDDIDVLLPSYVPNVMPNRKHRAKPIGRSDTAGNEGLMDALDEAWTSWVRDIRLGKARLIVPHEFLNFAGRGKGAAFDVDQEIFSPLNMEPGAMEKAGITPVQFGIRVEEHERSTRALFTQIAQAAGYSPQSFGLPGEGAAQTATEVDARQDRSIRTTSRKQGYWRRPLSRSAYAMLALDREIFGSSVEPDTPAVRFPDVSEPSARDMAETLNLLSAAKVASIDTRVRMLHPEWETPQVQEEVARIQREDGLMVDDPTNGVV